MKRLINVTMTCAALIIAFAACKKDPPPVAVSLEVVPSEKIVFSAEAVISENKTITVTTGGDWSMSSSADWCLVTKNKDNTFTVSAQANASTTQTRTATITVKAEQSGKSSAQKTIAVEQQKLGAAHISASSASLALTYDQTAATDIVVTTNQSVWDVTLSSDASSWLTATKGTGKITVTAMANTGAVRTATVTLTAGEGSNTATATVAVTQGTDPMAIEMVNVAAGSFLMGSSATETNRQSDEGPQRTVTLSAFKMSKYEVTNAQFAHFLNTAPGITMFFDGNISDIAKMTIDGQSRELALALRGEEFDKPFTNKYNPATNKWSPAAGYESHPAVHLSWWGAKAYADWVGGTLPSEAQWEYAARAGATTPWYWGSSAANVSTYEWIGLAAPTTNPVGKKTANAFGLHDMIGNAQEWCMDGYKNTYPSENQTDPIITDFGTQRVVRGSSPDWPAAEYGRSAYRSKLDMNNSNSNMMGFRIVKP